MTSNVGAKKVSDFGAGIGFESHSSMATQKSHVESIIRKELKNKFAPEFLNRLDDMILFNSLSKDNMLEIVDIELNRVITRLEKQGYSIKINKTAKAFLAEQGYDPLYGARPLKRAVQNYVEDILADAIIDKKMTIGTKVYSISYKKGEDKLSLK
jgi:ATP-dependent Clp protease ATP-binding subunit ClpC